MARRNAKAGGAKPMPYVQLAPWAARADSVCSRVANGWNIGQRLVLLEPKISIGAQCYHIASGTETLRFRLRAFTGGTIWATKDVTVSATNVVSVDWDTEYEIPINTPFTISVFNVTNAAYTNLSSNTAIQLMPTGAPFNLGAGIYRSFGVYGVGDIAPATTSGNSFPVDCRFKA